MVSVGSCARMEALPRVGRLIAFEGPNEVGKTTISQALAHRIGSRGIPCEWHAFPGRLAGTLGHHVYRLHHARDEFGLKEIAPAALQALHIAAHLDAIERVLLPKLGSGVDIVLDRFWWSTVAYGVATGVSRALLESLVNSELLAWQGRTPTLVIVLERQGTPHTQAALTDPLRTQYRTLVSDAYGRHAAHIVGNHGTVAETTAKVADLLDKATSHCA